MLAVFNAQNNEPPATIYATLRAVVGTSTPVENFLVLDFDDTTVEYADFAGFMPAYYAGGGVTITFVWSAAATTNNGAWAAAFRDIPDDAEDLDTTAFTYDYNTTADLTPPSVVGETAEDTLAFTSGADMDSVAASHFFRLRVKRPAPSGTPVAGDCSIHFVILRET